MTPLIDKHQVLSDIKKAQQLLDPLRELYKKIPATTCDRQARCCTLIPEVSYIELLHMVRALGRLPRDVRTEIMEKTIKYFFLNAVQIDSCPFLHHNTCRIYEDRPYTCRAYGLWSAAHYEILVKKSKKAKESIHAAWETLGVKLPLDVVAYQPDYCNRVTITSGNSITDAELDLIQTEIFSLERDLEQGMRRFTQDFLSDPSFFLTSAILGYQSCLIEKVAVVRECLSNKGSSRLKQLIDGIRESIEHSDIKLS